MAQPGRLHLLDSTDPRAPDWSLADLWRIIVLDDEGVPCAWLWLPSPGAMRDGDALARRIVDEHGPLLAQRAEARRARRRLGIGAPAPRRTCSLIVCTRARSAYLPLLLERVQALDPAPAEVIVIDNDPANGDTRRRVEAIGARYVPEPRRGLDHARNAGLALATSELVAFTDDDCVPPPGWLRRLDEHFAHPATAAVTGPAFAWELATPSQLRFERSGGFTRSAQMRAFDIVTHSPVHAGQVGAGANMVFRAEELRRIGFPPELDAGTATESGGDLYPFYRLLAEGRRIVYDPGTYTFHRHRRDPDRLHRAFRSYGIGLGAFLTKVLVEHREPATVAAWSWLGRHYVRNLIQRHLRGGDAVDLHVAWNYLDGGLRGWVRWLRSARTPPPAFDGARPAPQDEPAPAARLDVTVVVPTTGRVEVLGRALAALSGQGAEIVVVDDSPDGIGAVPGADVVVRSGGLGAAAARNRGAASATRGLLLFLDDDIVASPGLVARHAAAHARADAPGLLIGRSAPRPRRRNLASVAAALWWEDEFESMRRTPHLAFTQTLAGNLSVPRHAFEALGGFDEELGRHRREDWRLGIAAREAGLQIAYLPDAVADHEYSLTTRGRLRGARAEGVGDGLIVRFRPAAAHALPALPEREGRLNALARHRSIPLLLDVLERANARRTWLRVFDRAQAAAYWSGRRSVPPAVAPAPSVLAVDPAAATPVACPPDAPFFPALDVGDGRLRGELGRWDDALASALASRAARDAAVPPPVLRAAPDAARVVLRTQADWQQIAARLRESRFVLAGLVDEPVPLGDGDGDRIAITLGVAGDGSPYLIGAHEDARPFALRSTAPVAFLLPRAAHDALGALRPDLARLGLYAPLLEYVNRALARRWTIAIVPTGTAPSARREAQRQSARARLLRELAGPAELLRGAGALVGGARRHGADRHLLGALGGYAWGGLGR